MPFKIVRNDITKMQVDAIVNTANEEPIYSSGTDYAVYQAAGADLLLAERKKIGYLEEGEVAITPGFNLPAKYIIHAVSPYYIDGESGEEELLRSCYQKSLELAQENGCESIAFPLISTGSFGYPKEDAMRIAVDEINGFLLKKNMLIYLVVFDGESTRLGQSLYPDLEAYIDRNYVCDKREEEYGDRYFGVMPEVQQNIAIMPKAPQMAATTAEQKPDKRGRLKAIKLNFPKAEKSSAQIADCQMMDTAAYEEFLEESESALNERIRHMGDSFQQYLMYLIERKGLTNAEVYKRAFVTKQLFSKIKLNPDYHPDKATAMRLCVGAGLNLDETKDLLARAGYALSPCDKRDIIFSYFIEREVFDMIEIDIVLENYDLPCFIV